MDSLLGAKLLGKEGDVATAEALAGKRAVGLYFSAHWCPPCRGFTPKLAEWYTKDLKAKGMEIVFVSSDRDDDAFNSYFGEMPWLALPFADRDKKAELSKKYKVQGIPSFVIIDDEGKTITTDGREAVSEDPTGEDFPWKPQSMAEILKDVKLLKGSDTVDIKDAFLDKKAIGLYFSAHWCPPCRGFTPKLAEWYSKDLQAKGLEIVFVSSDKDAGAFKDYYGEQPWLALNFEDRQAKSKLSKACKVNGIPSFVIIDPSDYSIINAEGRAAVSADPEGNELPWTPKPVKNLSGGPGSINEIPTVLVFCETQTAAEQKAIEDALSPLGEKYIAEGKAKGEDPEFGFLIATSSDDLSTRIRGMMKIGEPAGAATLVLVDIPSDGAFHVAPAEPITTASVEKFLADYKAGNLERKQLG